LDDAVTFTVINVPERERFEARDDAGTLAGVLTYQLTGAIVAYTHTAAEPGFEDQQVESALAQAAMDDAQARNRLVVPICPLLSGWLDKHPQYEKSVARSTRKVK
jgi:predicted GNAT family acetyltransferase